MFPTPTGKFRQIDYTRPQGLSFETAYSPEAETLKINDVWIHSLRNTILKDSIVPIFYLFIYLFIYIYIFKKILYIYIYIHTFVFTFAPYTHIYTHTHTHTHVYIKITIYTCTGLGHFENS